MPTSERSCPTCFAKPGESCRSPGPAGEHTTTHGQRDEPLGVVFWRDRRTGELIAAESKVDALDRQLGNPLSPDIAGRVIAMLLGQAPPVGAHLDASSRPP